MDNSKRYWYSIRPLFIVMELDARRHGLPVRNGKQLRGVVGIDGIAGDFHLRIHRSGMARRNIH